MKRLTITQEGYEIYVDNNILPAEFSAGIEVEFIKDKAYEDYTVLPSVKYDNKTYALTYVNGIVTLPAQAFEQDGAIYLAFLLSNGNEHINTYPIELFVVDSVGGSDVLPDEKEIWVSIVENQVDQYMDIKYVSIMNEVLEANKKLNLDTIALQRVVNEVVEILNKKLDNNDFVPKHKLESGKLFFTNPNGSWDSGYALAGQTTISLDEVVQENLTMSSVRDTTKEKVFVQLQDATGNPIIIEVDSKNCYRKSNDGTKEIKQSDLDNLISKLINLIPFWDSSPKPILDELNKFVDII